MDTPFYRGSAPQNASKPGVSILLKRESYGPPRRVLRASLESMVPGCFGLYESASLILLKRESYGAPRRVLRASLESSGSLPGHHTLYLGFGWGL